ncbi:MAG: hypothetical protein RR224_11845 [Clostridia bacterium]
MKRKILILFLVAEALACIVLVFCKASLVGVFSTVAAFPFEQIGLMLRGLSLSGSVGNVFAVVLYVLFSLIPVGMLVFTRRKRKLQAEDWLLPILSGLLSFVLYQMVNPGLMAKLLQSVSVGKAILGGTAYSLVFSYLILRVLRRFDSGGMEQLQRYMVILLGLINTLFVFLIFSTGLGGLLDSISALRAGNMGNDPFFTASYFFCGLQFLVDTVPYTLDILVVFSALTLFDKMKKDRYAKETVDAAVRLSRLCGTALRITVLSVTLFNVLQLVFAKYLLNIHTAVQIPLLSIAFVLLALLFARLVKENKALKDDSDSII